MYERNEQIEEKEEEEEEMRVSNDLERKYINVCLKLDDPHAQHYIHGCRRV